jgi:hypothetical protein
LPPQPAIHFVPHSILFFPFPTSAHSASLRAAICLLPLHSFAKKCKTHPPDSTRLIHSSKMSIPPNCLKNKGLFTLWQNTRGGWAYLPTRQGPHTHEHPQPHSFHAVTSQFSVDPGVGGLRSLLYLSYFRYPLTKAHEFHLAVHGSRVTGHGSQVTKLQSIIHGGMERRPIQQRLSSRAAKTAKLRPAIYVIRFKTWFRARPGHGTFAAGCEYKQGEVPL